MVPGGAESQSPHLLSPTCPANRVPRPSNGAPRCAAIPSWWRSSSIVGPVTDEVIEMFDHCLADAYARAGKDLEDFRKAMAQATNEKVHLFRELARAVLDPAIADPHLRPAIYTRLTPAVLRRAPTKRTGWSVPWTIATLISSRRGMGICGSVLPLSWRLWPSRRCRSLIPSCRRWRYSTSSTPPSAAWYPQTLQPTLSPSNGGPMCLPQTAALTGTTMSSVPYGNCVARCGPAMSGYPRVGAMPIQKPT